MRVPYDESRRRFLKLAVLTLGSAFLYACGADKLAPILTPTPTTKYGDSFALGSTVFRFDNAWADKEKKALFNLIETVYPILKNLYGTEPTDTQNNIGVTITIIKDSNLQSGLYGIHKLIGNGEYQEIGLRDSRPHNAIHELAHSFWGTARIPADIFHEGFPEAAMLFVGSSIGVDYTMARRQDAGLTIFNPQIFNKPKIATYADFLSNSGLSTIRYVLSGQAWHALFRQDQDFLRKFRQNYHNRFLASNNRVNVDSLNLTARESFSDDFYSFTTKRPILSRPILGKSSVMFAPTLTPDNGEGLTIVAFSVGDMEESLLRDVPVEYSMTDSKGQVVFSRTLKTLGADPPSIITFSPGRYNHRLVAKTPFDEDELILQLYIP